MEIFRKNKVNIREEIKRGRLGLILIIFIIPILLAGFYYSWLANGLILFIGSAALFYVTLLGRSLSTQNARKKFILLYF